MRRVAAPLLFLAVLVAAVVAWPRSQPPGSAKDATTGDAVPAGNPRLATAPEKLKPAASGESPPNPPSAAVTPFRFEVLDEKGPLADATITTTEGTALGRTDARGRLSSSFSAPGMWSSVGVIVRHPGYAPASTIARRDEICRITLERGGSLRGRVVRAPDDLPVEGARVIASAGGVFRGTLGETVTDAAGRFELVDAPRGDAIEFVVRAPGHAVTRSRGRVGDEVLVRLEEGGIVEGVVSDAQGRPIPNAEVLLLAPEDPLPTARLRYALDEVSRTTTDAAGRYEIAGVYGSGAHVAVALQTETLFGRSAPFAFERVNERLRRDVVVPAAGGLQVVVEGPARSDGSEDGVFVSGGGLEVFLPTTARSPDGKWEFAAMTPGRYEVRLLVLGSPFVGQYAQIEAGKTTEVHLAFRGEKSVEGRVTTEDGTGVPHATLWWAGSFGAARTVTTTDEDGRFLFVGLDETPGILIAEAFWDKPKGEPVGRTVLEGVVPGASAPVRLVLGRVGKVRVHLPDLAPGTTVRDEMHGRFGQSAGGSSLVSPEGTLELPVGVLGIPVEIVLRVPASAPLRFEVAPLAAGEIRDLGEMRFEAGRDVVLRVVDEREAPVPTARVDTANPYAVPETTDARGEVTLRHASRAGFPVAVSAPNRTTHVLAIAAATAGPIVIRLEAEGTLEIRVSERDGSPAAAARITLLTAEGNPFNYEPDAFTRDEKTDAAGIWRGPAQPRAYRLNVRNLSGEADTRATAVVRSGETTTVTVRLP